MAACANVDCDAGRRQGCRTFCCRLLVRLAPEERTGDGKGFVDKDAEGLCVHLDRDTFLCRIWERRPKVCREYDCNADDLLQVALRQEFRTIVDLAKAATRMVLPREKYLRVPHRDEAGAASEPVNPVAAARSSSNMNSKN